MCIESKKAIYKIFCIQLKTEMKNTFTILFLIFNSTFVFCQELVTPTDTKQETDVYSISCPKNFKFSKNEALAPGLFEEGFSIVKDEKSLIIIQFTIVNCERLGMGLVGFKNAIEENKTVKKRKTASNREYDVLEYDEDGFAKIEYIFTSNYTLYSLSGICKMEDKEKNSLVIERIMNSFELK